MRWMQTPSRQLPTADTDGMTDCRNPQGEFFGVERLCSSFMVHRGLSPGLLVKQLLAEVRGFRGDAPLRDDIAMVVMQVN